MAGSGTAHLRPEDETLLRVENLVVEFPVGRSGLRVHAVSDVSLDIKEGETLGLVGESGCGKSTTGKAIMQLPRPNKGTVRFEGQDLTKLSGEDLRRTRTRMKMIFQDPISSLNPRRKVEDIIAEGLRIWQELDRPPAPRSFTAALAAIVNFAVAIGFGLLALFFVIAAIVGHFSILERIGVLGLGGFAVMFGLIFRTAGLDVWNLRRSGWQLSLVLWCTALVVSLFVVVSGGAVAWATLALEVGMIALLLLPSTTRVFPRDPEWLRKRVDEMMADVGLDPTFQRGRRPHQFSGGQCQRISIARAVITNPKLIICDEPVSALDVSVQAQILNLLEDMKERYGLTLIFIAHDLAVVKNVSDRVVVMYLGKICEVGDPDTLFRQPAHPYTAALLAAIPVPDPNQRPEDRPHLGGEIPSPVAPPSGCRFRTRCPKAQERCAQEEPEVREIAPGQYVACHFPLAAGESLPSRNGQTADVS